MDLRRRCNRGPEKKVHPWTLEEGAAVDLRSRCIRDLRRRCNRGPERRCIRDLRRRCNRDLRRRCNRDIKKKVQPSP